MRPERIKRVFCLVHIFFVFMALEIYKKKYVFISKTRLIRLIPVITCKCTFDDLLTTLDAWPLAI